MFGRRKHVPVPPPIPPPMRLVGESERSFRKRQDVYIWDQLRKAFLKEG